MKKDIKNTWKLFSKDALTVAVLSVGVMAASCSKDEVALSDPNTSSPTTQSHEQSIQDQYIVVLNESAMQQAGDRSNMSFTQRNELVQNEMNAILSANGIQGSRINNETVFASLAAGSVVKLSRNEAEQLKKDPRIASIEADKSLNFGPASTTTTTTTSATQVVSWGVTKIGGAGNGVGKTAWIIDSGIDMDHPDLTVDGGRSRSFLTSASGGNWSSPDDELGHGTQVAGIVAAKNNGIGAVGVAAGATVVSLRIMNYQGMTYSSYLTRALDYVYANGKAGDVVNLSCSFGANSTIDYYVRKVASKGIFIAIASGNNGADCITKSPARVDGTNIYTVSGMNANNARLSYSNYGSPVDYAAPSDNVYTTNKNGGYVNSGGTSMAAPHLAGILLLNNGAANYSGTVTGDPDGKPDRIAKR